MSNILFNDIPRENLLDGVAFQQPIKLTIIDLYLLSHEDIKYLNETMTYILSEPDSKINDNKVNKVCFFPDQKYVKAPVDRTINPDKVATQLHNETAV